MTNSGFANLKDQRTVFFFAIMDTFQTALKIILKHKKIIQCVFFSENSSLYFTTI